jgi:hypothetical protein
VVELVDEAPIHLERLDRELLQLAERRIAGAEVVDHEMQPQVA